MKDYLIRALDQEGRIRITIADTTNSVEYMRKIHDSSATATAALGRSFTGAAIMGDMMKNPKDSLSLKIYGGGPIGHIVMVANNRGEVKGYCDHPYEDLDSINGHLDVGGLVGRDGFVTVVKDLGLKEPYVGQSNLVSGEIAEDLTYYYAISEQQPSAVSLGVLVDRDLSVRAAGGFLIQLMPGVGDEDLEKIEETLSRIQPISKMIEEGLKPEDILDQVLGDFNMNIVKRQEISFKCDCSRDRVRTALSKIGSEELEDMILKDKGAQASCHFCNSLYDFSEKDLREIILDKK